jgi:hypothetical protein
MVFLPLDPSEWSTVDRFGNVGKKFQAVLCCETAPEAIYEAIVVD